MKCYTDLKETELIAFISTLYTADRPFYIVPEIFMLHWKLYFEKVQYIFGRLTKFI